MRVAIAGFQHETNTFAPQKATYRHFEEGEGWPALTQGAALFRDVEGYSERANVLIDESGKVTWVKVYPVHDLPDIDEVLARCAE